MIKFWIIGPLFLLASFAFLIFGVKNRVDVETLRSGDFLEIRGSIEASYKPSHDFINIIVLHLKNPNFSNKQVFVFSVLEDGKVVRRLEFNGQNVGDPSDLRFQFEPIADSSSKSLLLRLEGVETRAPFLSAAITQSGELTYRAYYRSSSPAGSFMGILSSFSDRVLEEPGFFIIWFLGLCAIVLVSRRNYI